MASFRDALARRVDTDLLSSSDADSDVLADYVLALVRSEDSDEQVKVNCLENLEDFLRDRNRTPPYTCERR